MNHLCFREEMSSGRPCDGIWQHFKQRTDLGPNKAECDSCGHVMTGNAQRLKTHYEKHEYGSLDPTARKEGPSASKLPKISDFVAFTNKTQQQKFEKCVGEFFFANNIPFVAVESGQFEALCKELHPSYSPESRQNFSNEILNECHESLVQS